jgi:hypothetical protein
MTLFELLEPFANGKPVLYCTPSGELSIHVLDFNRVEGSCNLFIEWLDGSRIQ